MSWPIWPNLTSSSQMFGVKIAFFLKISTLKNSNFLIQRLWKQNFGKYFSIQNNINCQGDLANMTQFDYFITNFRGTSCSIGKIIIIMITLLTILVSSGRSPRCVTFSTGSFLTFYRSYNCTFLALFSLLVSSGSLTSLCQPTTRSVYRFFWLLFQLTFFH